MDQIWPTAGLDETKRLETCNGVIGFMHAFNKTASSLLAKSLKKIN